MNPKFMNIRHKHRLNFLPFRSLIKKESTIPPKLPNDAADWMKTRYSFLGSQYKSNFAVKVYV